MLVLEEPLDVLPVLRVVVRVQVEVKATLGGGCGDVSSRRMLPPAQQSWRAPYARVAVPRLRNTYCQTLRCTEVHGAVRC